MILVDTSVLIAQYRKFDLHRAVLFAHLDPLVCGMVVAEFLAGARKPPQLATCQALLAQFPSAATPEMVWELAGRYQGFLASNGLTVPLSDTIIATLAIATSLELWAYDTHFSAMATLLPGLTLFVEPTP